MNKDAKPVVVVLTALDVEYRAVRDLLADLSVRPHPAGSLFEVGQLPSRHGCLAVGLTGVGNSRAAVMAERAVAMFQPVALLFVGVAGALHDEIESAMSSSPPWSMRTTVARPPTQTS